MQSCYGHKTTFDSLKGEKTTWKCSDIFRKLREEARCHPIETATSKGLEEEIRKSKGKDKTLEMMSYIQRNLASSIDVSRIWDPES